MDDLRLRLGSSPVLSLMQLLGSNERALTDALGWGFAQSVPLLSGIVDSILGPQPPQSHGVATVYLQRHHDAGGFTDIEVDSLPAYALILEAKKGLQLPALAQLAKYAARLNDLPGARAILVVADVHEDVARYQGLPHEVLGITVGYMPWSAIVQMTAHCAKQAMPRGRHDLNELTEFLRWNVDV